MDRAESKTDLLHLLFVTQDQLVLSPSRTVQEQNNHKMLHVIEASPISIGYLVLGGFVVLFSLTSLLLKERLYVGEVVLGTAFGIIIGPYCANIFDPRSWASTPEVQNRITLEVMRIVLAVGLFAIGVELPTTYLKQHARSLLVMTVPTMAFGWLVVAAIIQALFPSLTYVSALTISACLTPTDPIIAAAITGGKYAVKNVPTHIQHLLGAESAANDGLAYPFLSISIYLATETSKSMAFGKWFLIGWLYQVIMGTILGILLGRAASHLIKFAHRKGLIDRESLVAQFLALAIFTIGLASTLGSDDLLAAFAAGSAVSWDGYFKANTKDEAFSSVIDLVLNCICFIYIGAWLPFQSYNDVSLGIDPWRLVVLFLAILAIRRIPCILLLYKFVPDIHNWREALFCGHFGPMGVSAIFVSTLAITELPRPNNPPASQNELLAATLHPVVSFVVLGSIIIHGLSITTFCFGRKSVERTVTLTATLSRTWTWRQGPSKPDWLLSIRRATKGELSGSDGTRSPVSVDIERDGVPKREEEAVDAIASARSSMTIFERLGGKHSNVHDKSGEDVTGLGYASMHNAKDNAQTYGQRQLEDAGITEVAIQEDGTHTVRFRNAGE